MAEEWIGCVAYIQKHLKEVGRWILVETQWVGIERVEGCRRGAQKGVCFRPPLRSEIAKNRIRLNTH